MKKMFLIAKNLFSGTFLCDNEQERETRGVYTQTTSIWSWLNQPDELPKYINPLYDPTPNVIWPSVAPMSFVIWEGKILAAKAVKKNWSNASRTRDKKGFVQIG